MNYFTPSLNKDSLELDAFAASEIVLADFRLHKTDN